jgi:sugar/nucleoside kinase (ribokinase family)
MESLDGEPFAQLLAEGRRRGLMTSLDTVWDGTGRWERVLPALRHVDLFCPSLAEARAITHAETPEQAARRLRERGCGAVALTLGPAGCYVAGDGFEGLVPGFSVAALDSTGAGDAFAAGFLYGRLGGWPLERSARFANACGALATTAVGAVEGLIDRAQALELAGFAS